MIVCARCGAQNQPTNKFCLSCGAPVQQPPAQPAGSAGSHQAAPQQPPAYGAPPGQGWGQPGHAPPPAQPAPHQQWGQQPPQQPPQQGWGQPPSPHQAGGGWGQPQHPPQQGGWGQPPQQAPQPGWGQPPQQQGGFAPAGAGFGQAPPHLRVGSPEGLNPFGATVGPEAASPPHGSPQVPGWPQDPALAATSPPTRDDYEPQAPAAPPRAPTPPPPPPQEPSAQAARDPEQLDANAPRALAGFLVSYEGNELGAFFPIHQGQNIVGRKGAAPGLNIEIDHGTTSSRHAILFASARPGRVKVEDVGSTNGTFVGEMMLERGKKHELKDGDVIRFGGYVAIVKIV